MKATVKWTDGAMFVGESGSGHAVVMDGAPDLGGRNLGPRPMEMLLIGTGGCSTYDVLSMLKKSRQEVVDCRVEIEAERADAVPAVFTRINMEPCGSMPESSNADRIRPSLRVDDDAITRDGREGYGNGVRAASRRGRYRCCELQVGVVNDESTIGNVCGKEQVVR